jgi:hypothetical protein
MAQNGHPDRLNQCPLLGVKQTLRESASMSAFDPWLATTDEVIE